MTNFTINSVLNSIRSDVQDVLSRFSQDEINELTPNDVCDLLDENNYYALEVIYYDDAWEIVTSSQFNDYDTIEKIDFSACENALDCIMLEAQMILDSVYYAERAVIAHEVLEDLQESLSDES